MARTPKKATSPAKSARDRHLPKYSIAVASDLSGVPQQQLRRMEDGGLVAPTRTEGNTRRYSDADIERISEVTQLAEGGVNSAGIRHILALRSEIGTLRERMAGMRHELDELRDKAAASPASPATAPIGDDNASRRDTPHVSRDGAP